MLNEDGRLAIPPRPPPGLTWLHVLKDLWPLRYLWTPCLIDSTGNEKGAHGAEGDESTPETNDNDVTPIWWRRDPSEALKKYNIGVLVRFRPEKEIQPLLSSGDKKDVGGGKDKFYLPLHQRLAIIRSRDQRKAKNNLRNNKSQISPEVTLDDDDDESNNKDEENNSNNNSNHRKKAPISMKKKTTGALKTLQGEGGWFGTDWKKSAFIEKDNKNGDSLSNNQDNNNDSSLSAHIHDVDPMSARVVAVAPGVGLREFQYDYVLPSRSTQSSVYEVIYSCSRL
jgi:hypothetical protein